jgi:hypothetical protein
MPLVIIAALILVSKPADSSDLDAKLLSSKALIFVGNISYSLYLWHWPVITFGTELGFADSILGKAGLAALAFGLATLSYYFVELKFQSIQLPKFYSDNSVPLSKPTWIGASSALLAVTLVLPSVAAQPSVQSTVAGFFDRPAVQPFPTLTPEPTQTEESGDKDWFTIRQAEIDASNRAIAKLGKLTEKQITEINRVASGDTYGDKTDFTCTWGDCTLGQPNAKVKILLLGDSHALMYHSTFSTMKRSGLDLFVKSSIYGLCANFLGTRSLALEQDASTNAGCDAQHKKTLGYVNSIGQTYDFVVLSDSKTFNPEFYVLDATEYANKVKQVANKTVILGQAPVSQDLSTCLNRDYSNYKECSSLKPTSRHDYNVAQNAQVAYADLGSLFCVDNFCPLIIGDSPVTARGHLTDAAGAQIAPYFLDFLKDAKVPEK